MVETNPPMIQVCCKHAQHTGKLHDLGVLARLGVCVCSRQVRCSDQIASYIRDIDPTNVLKKNMLRSIQNCPLCAVKSDNMIWAMTAGDATFVLYMRTRY